MAEVVPVDIVLDVPNDEIVIVFVFEGGSASNFGIDDLEFDRP